MRFVYKGVRLIGTVVYALCASIGAYVVITLARSSSFRARVKELWEKNFGEE